jgi:molybdate transport system substrate-binding protein
MRLPFLLVLALLWASPPEPAPITVFAASDLGPAFKAIVPQFEAATGTKVTLVFGSTGMLAQQIRNGAPADVFFAANQSFVDDLSKESLALEGTRSLYARGRIAVVTLKSSPVSASQLKDLASPHVRRIAIANPQHAPYGLAARQSLERSGLWKAVESRLVFGENVQQAVQFVRSGSAEAGIVARSVAGTPDLNWTLVDDALHAPLNQVAIVVARSAQPDKARTFIGFVNGAQGRVSMRQYGFVLPGEVF